MKYILLLIVCISQFQAAAQKGDYLLTHFKPDVVGLDNSNFDIAVDANGLLSMANRSGLIQFDGEHWDYTPAPGALLSLDISKDEIIFSGGVNDIGYFDYLDNTFQFISLAGDQKFDDLFYKTMITGDFVYFLSENKIVRYNRSNNELRIILNPAGEYFLSLFRLKDQVFAQSESHLYILNDFILEPTKFQLPDFSEVQFVAKHPSREEYLFGTTLNQLYILREDSTFKTLKVSKEIVSNDYYAYDGTWISEDIFAVSTFEAGCLIIDRKKDSIINEINYNSGLPDNEVLAIVSDNEHGLWMAHEYGLTRVVPDVPILSFSNYPGINGNLLAMTREMGKTYVATSSGVFYFDQEKRFRNNVYYTVERINKRVKKPAAKPTQTKAEEQPQSGKKKGLLGKLFKKKKSTSTEQESEEEPKKGLFGRIIEKISDPFSGGEVKNIKGKPDENTRYVRRVKRELISSRFLFKKVDGLDSKTKQLLQFKDHLLAVSSSGLYEITDSVANLVHDESILHAFATEQYLLLATDDHRIKVFELLDDLWIESASFEVSNEIIVNIFSDHVGRIWVVSTNSLYQFDPEGLDLGSLPFAQIPNQYIDHVRGTVINDKIYLINSSGYFYFDEVSGAVKPDSALFKRLGRPMKHLQQTNGIVWVFDGQSWSRIDEDNEIDTYQLLGMFKDMTFIDEVDGNLWIIDANKQLYQFDREQGQEMALNNKMFIRAVRNPEGEIRRTGDIKFSYENNSIHFELSRPDYLGISQVEYQYKLVGLMEDWSAWNSSNTVDFNYLPPGNYEMIARSRDVFGEVQESKEFSFGVNTPYWQRPWFYAIQIILFVALVVGSARLNHGETKGKYFLLAEGLTLLTLVLIIEFLQTLAGDSLGFESTPVIDFAVDVGTALMIFPIEFVLKRVIKSGAELSKLKKMLKGEQVERA